MTHKLKTGKAYREIIHVYNIFRMISHGGSAIPYFFANYRTRDKNRKIPLKVLLNFYFKCQKFLGIG